VEILTDQRPDLAVVDRGYRGHGEDKTRVLISGTRRGLTPKLIADLRRRSAIEAEIGHMKTDGRLSRCPLKGTIGDALFAVLCACGHNIRKILAHLRAWLAWMVGQGIPASPDHHATALMFVAACATSQPRSSASLTVLPRRDQACSVSRQP
jgi:hypothetical protein